MKFDIRHARDDLLRKYHSEFIYRLLVTYISECTLHPPNIRTISIICQGSGYCYANDQIVYMAVCWHEIGVYGNQTTIIAQNTKTNISSMLFRITEATSLQGPLRKSAKRMFVVRCAKFFLTLWCGVVRHFNAPPTSLVQIKDNIKTKQHQHHNNSNSKTIKN